MSIWPCRPESTFLTTWIGHFPLPHFRVAPGMLFNTALGSLILYEFQQEKHPDVLWLPTFDSAHGQMWWRQATTDVQFGGSKIYDLQKPHRVIYKTVGLKQYKCINGQSSLGHHPWHSSTTITNWKHLHWFSAFTRHLYCNFLYPHIAYLLHTILLT